MSRIGRQPIIVPQEVNVTIDGSVVNVAGPKGNLSQNLIVGISVEQKDGVLLLTRPDDEAINRSNHGLMRTLIYNMVIGVTNGFSKKLELNGVGFKVANSATGLKFSLGFSHDVEYTLPDGVTATIDNNLITISGINKQQVGQAAAEIRSLKKPEPYKGKGIKYLDERILRKSGKSGKEKA
ncbi:MAG TPA: 50S ribosomal protein L6 [Candidatus Saccharimonadia bacterium]|nr:50S ribosomal protein L6 [Candidatus Saccharimonadia bacterium]